MLYRHRSLRYGVSHARIHELRALIKPAVANTAMPLAMALNIQGMTLVVGATLGSAAVVVFSTLRTLTRVGLRLVMSISHAVEPELAASWGAQDKRRMQSLYGYALSSSFWVSLGVATVLFFLGSWVLSAWTDAKVAMDSALFRWLLLSAVATVLWFNGLSMLKAANRHLRSSLWYVFSSLAALVLAACLLYSFEKLSYAGLALLVTDALMAVYVIFAAGRLIDLSPSRILLQMVDCRRLVSTLLVRVRSHAG